MLNDESKNVIQKHNAVHATLKSIVRGHELKTISNHTPTVSDKEKNENPQYDWTFVPAMMTSVGLLGDESIHFLYRVEEKAGTTAINSLKQCMTLLRVRGNARVWLNYGERYER